MAAHFSTLFRLGKGQARVGGVVAAGGNTRFAPGGKGRGQDADNLNFHYRIKSNGAVLNWEGLPTMGMRHPCKVVAAEKYASLPASNENIPKRAWSALTMVRLATEIACHLGLYQASQRQF